MASAIGETISKLKEYVDVKTEQIKLLVLARMASVLSNVISLSIVLLFSFFMIFFVSFALANLFNEIFESTYLGYLLISAGYLLVIILVLILMKSGIIQGWIESAVLRATEKEDNEED